MTRLIFFLVFIFLCFPTAQATNWVGIVKSATKNILGAAGEAVGSTVRDTAESNSVLSSQRLRECRAMAAMPYGTSAPGYREQCSAPQVIGYCAQVALTDRSMEMDPYCLTMMGGGTTIGPWGGSSSPISTGLTTSGAPAKPISPDQIGWSVPVTMPYSSFGLRNGYLGGGSMLSSMGTKLATSFVSSLLNRMYEGNSEHSNDEDDDDEEHDRREE